MKVQYKGLTLELRKQTTKSSGECVCCDGPAFPWAVEGLSGVVDTCAEHAEQAYLDALKDGAIKLER